MDINARNRLNEASSFLKKAAESYQDKNEFIINTNACIQALRNVTWVLQSQKKDIPNFENWYNNDWQQSLIKDLIMKWLVESRNKIVKSSDLEAFSYMCLSVHEKYTESAKYTINVDPFLGNEDFVPFRVVIE